MQTDEDIDDIKGAAGSIYGGRLGRHCLLFNLMSLK
jgi:hypothetical protein